MKVKQSVLVSLYIITGEFVCDYELRVVALYDMMEQG